MFFSPCDFEEEHYPLSEDGVRRLLILTGCEIEERDKSDYPGLEFDAGSTNSSSTRNARYLPFLSSTILVFLVELRLLFVFFSVVVGGEPSTIQGSGMSPTNC